MYRIRKAVPDDAGGITFVNVSTWKTAYQGLIPDKLIDKRMEEWEERTEKCKRAIEKGASVLVAEEDGRIIGFCSYGKSRSDQYRDAGEIYALYVVKEYQKKGAGKALFHAAVNRLEAGNYCEMILNCMRGNPSLEFYKHLNGRVVGERQDIILDTCITEDIINFPIARRLLEIDRKDYVPGGSVFYRIAVRAFIHKDRKYAMIHSKKYGEYKFPGGGRKSGEELKETLIREVREETGLTVIPSSLQSVGYVQERRKGEYADIMEMISYYYICEAANEIGEQNLDNYEKEYGYSLEYVTLEDAVQNNEALKGIEHIPWVDRDTAVMRLLLAENEDD